MIIFEVLSALGKKIRLTEKILTEIVTKHPELENQTDKMKETLISPEVIRKSKYDVNVLLNYKFYQTTPVTNKYLMVALKY